MRKLKVTRSMILAFIVGMSLSRLSIGAKLCIAVPLVIVWLMSYDDALAEKKGKEYDYPVR